MSTLQKIVVENVSRGVAFLLSVRDALDWDTAKAVVDKIFSDDDQNWPPMTGAVAAPTAYIVKTT